MRTAGGGLERHLSRQLWRRAALMVAVILAWAAEAVAQPTAPPVLRIAIGDTSQAVFDDFVPALSSVGGLPTPPVITHGTPLAVLRAFCERVGGNSPDIVITTRRLRLAMARDCEKNGVEHMAQVELGSVALVLAVRRGSPVTALTARDIYLALARDVPDKDEFRRNTNVRWSDIRRSLPQEDIRFQLPPRDEGGRALFSDLVMQGGCREEPLIKIIFAADLRTARCVTTRIDRVREIPSGQAVRALLDAPIGTIGVLSLQDIAQSGGQLVPVALDGVVPTEKTILEGSYDYASPYWLYAKRGQARRRRAPAIDAAVDRMIAVSLTETVLGPDGALARLGVIPLPADDREEQRQIYAKVPNPYSVQPVINWISYTAGAAQGLVELALGQSDQPTNHDALDFTKLMDLAGYATEEFQTTVGLLPSADMTFGIAREMSEADQDYLERRLLKDAHARPGPLASMQRRIVRAVLDASEADNYEISQVQIELVPLPSFKLVVTPKDAPMSQDTTSILRAIERLGNRMSEMTQ